MPDVPAATPTRYGFSYISEPLAPFVTMHRHDEIEMGMPTGGSITALVGAQRVRLHEGQFGVFWANQPHGPISVDTGTRAEVILVPLAWVLGWNLPSSFVYRLLRGEVILAPATGSSAFPDVNLVRNWVELMRMGTPDAQRIVLLEAQARLLRLSLEIDHTVEHSAPAPKPTVLKAGEASHFEHMVHFMATHYQQQINVEHVAGAVRLHPKYAMRLFRRTCGVTMLEYLTQQRVSHAQRLLATTDLKILDVSEESGFHSPSRFYAVFVRLCGCAPAHYRRSLRTEMHPSRRTAKTSSRDHPG